MYHEDIDFSPVDACARAIVLLAGTPRRYTVFHCQGPKQQRMQSIMDAMHRIGIVVKHVSDYEYSRIVKDALHDDVLRTAAGNLMKYDNNSGSELLIVPTDNSYSVEALRRLGFEWPEPDAPYLDRALGELRDRGMFTDPHDTVRRPLSALPHLQRPSAFRARVIYNIKNSHSRTNMV